MGSTPRTLRKDLEVMTRGWRFKIILSFRESSRPVWNTGDTVSNKLRAGELGHWAKVLSAKPGNLSSVLSTHISETEQ